MFRHLFPKIFRISLAGALLILSLSLVALVISNRANIASKFNNAVSPVAQQSFATQLQGLNDNKVLNFAVIVITWSGIGLVAYTIIWIGMLILTEARNDIVVETEYVNRGPLKDRLRVPLIQIALLVTTLLVLGLSFNNLFPIWSVFFAEFVWRIPTDLLGSVPNFLISVGGLSLNAYLVKVLFTALISIE